jgi:hypothetical protein
MIAVLFEALNVLVEAVRKLADALRVKIEAWEPLKRLNSSQKERESANKGKSKMIMKAWECRRGLREFVE